MNLPPLLQSEYLSPGGRLDRAYLDADDRAGYPVKLFLRRLELLDERLDVGVAGHQFDGDVEFF